MNKNKKISHSKQETISIRDRSFITTWGAGILEGGYNFLRGLILGRQF